MYLAHHEPEGANIVIVVIGIVTRNMTNIIGFSVIVVAVIP